MTHTANIRITLTNFGIIFPTNSPNPKPTPTMTTTYPDDVQVLPHKGGLLRGRLSRLGGRRSGEKRAQRHPSGLVVLESLRLTAQREGYVVIGQTPAVALVHLAREDGVMVRDDQFQMGEKNGEKFADAEK